MPKGGDAILDEMSRLVAARAMAVAKSDNWPDVQGVIIDMAPTLETAQGFVDGADALENPKRQKGAKTGKEVGRIDSFRQRALDNEMAEVNALITEAAKVTRVMVEASHESPEFYHMVMLQVTAKC